MLSYGNRNHIAVFTHVLINMEEPTLSRDRQIPEPIKQGTTGVSFYTEVDGTR